ncbi:MAG: HNH endonuclease [Gemmatimonadaceae bacterium]|nr:HNH endonuclease [Gemmatimonadaceae bacterium]
MRAPYPKAPPRIVACIVCGATFVVQGRGHVKRRHCDEHRERRWVSYYARNKKRVLEQRSHRVDELRAWFAAYRKANKGKRNVWHHRRRARQVGATGRHTHEEWLLVLRDLPMCFWCGRRDAALTKDHLFPLSRGGTDDINNIVPACRRCNSRKREKTPREYLDWLAEVGAA